MRAIVHDRYGSPDVLRLEDVERPVPGEDEVLVRVHATTVNRTDCHRRAAEPFAWRLIAGLRRPRRQILGSELAGRVAAAGPAVTEFVAGDPVFGLNPWALGAHAEFVCVRASGLIAHKAGASFAEAAAVCDGGLNALSALRRAGLRTGHKILIYGASGSIGTAAVQLARHMEAHVTAVCDTRNLATVASLGADRVIDYTAEDFTRNGQAYDVIYDAAAALVPALQRLAEPGRDLPGHRRLAERGPVLADLADPVQEGGLPDGPVRQGGRRAPQAAHRGGGVPRRDRPELPAGARGRGRQVRRDAAEDRERRADRGRLRTVAC